MRWLVVGAGFFVALAGFMWAFSGTMDPDQPDPEFLATDMHFLLGGLRLTLPAVAVSDLSKPPDNVNPLPRYESDPRIWGEPRWFQTREHKDAFIAFSGDPARPAIVSHLDLSLSGYGSYGEWGISAQICPQLTQDWSRELCKRTGPSWLEDLPERVDLVSRNGLAIFKYHSFAGITGVTLDDLIATMPLDSPVPTIACTSDQAFCYAGSQLAPDVFAVWNLPGSPMAPADREAEALREGAALAAVFPLWLD